ncbi:cilia- and flagella-associated protein 95 [Spea bombifrons]|uniref:cilia- and flagella-associated protein 95 n=1 Tax=Spea bombifrons TaxID=233779 RepID=UPI00234AC6BE|nr:cilia- and flagella-associated protein 95 [Spea bombifrons]
MCTLNGTLKSNMLETKGSLYLRSNHMQYDRPTLVSGWHQSRETEPKDYDLRGVPAGKKNLCHSTYRRLGNLENEVWGTTTEEHLSQVNLKKEYEVKEVPKSMVNEDNINIISLERQTGRPETNLGHSKDQMKMQMETIYETDYTPPHCYTPYKYPEVPNYSSAYKKCHSQFTDTADYRRFGRNTWQDESGIYANNEIKQMVFKPTCPITPHL